MAINQNVNIPASGKVGAVPPPDAPIEKAQPVAPDGGGMVVFDPVTRQPTGEVVLPTERAAKNERQLQPLKAPGRPLTGAVAAAVMGTPSPVTQDVASLVSDVFGEQTPFVAPKVPGHGEPIPPSDPQQSEVDQVEDIMPALTDEDRLRMPAASETDSPSKGILKELIPQQRGDKWDGISRGGFSDVGEAQYYPLTGEELAEVVRGLFDSIAAQMQNDLRFSIALTYPSARITVRVEVEGSVEENDHAFSIERVQIPKDAEKGSTPLAIARQLGDQVVFVITGLRQEFTQDGQVEAPPDQMRLDAGLPRPQKTMLYSGDGRQMSVDIVAPGADVRALTR